MRRPVGVAARGVIGGVQGTTEGSVTAGVKAVGQWPAGRPGRPGQGVNRGISEPPRGPGWLEYGQSLPPAAVLRFCATPSSTIRPSTAHHSDLSDGVEV